MSEKTRFRLSTSFGKLDEKEQHFVSLQELLNDPATLSNPQKLVAASKEAGQLEPWSRCIAATNNRLAGGRAARADEFTRQRDVGAGAIELPDAEAKGHQSSKSSRTSSSPPRTTRSIVLPGDSAPGTGGEEAALSHATSRDVPQVHEKSAGSSSSRTSPSPSAAVQGGHRQHQGRRRLPHIQFEGGGHRVQRVPETKRRAASTTSAATVAVLPEMPDVQIHIDPKDVEEAVPGRRTGRPERQQGRNRLALLHKPTGIQFKMTEHKSQAQNKERAWALLARHALRNRARQAARRAHQRRKTMMGSGDRSQRIRTYNFPQNRCTDHRLGGEGGGEKTSTSTRSCRETWMT
jgi:peptide chain release factor 1